MHIVLVEGKIEDKNNFSFKQWDKKNRKKKDANSELSFYSTFSKRYPSSIFEILVPLELQCKINCV